MIGPFGLGIRNERGDTFAEWCEQNGQAVMNTWFKHHPRYLWTWKSPDEGTKNQIDYITINKRFRNSITQAKTRPGADCGSDHVPVMAVMKVKLRKLKKKKNSEYLEIKKLTEPDIKSRYSIAVRNKYEELQFFIFLAYLEF